DVKHAIVRTMVLYGTGIAVRPNFVTWLIAALQQKRQVNIVTDQIGNPTLADELAAAILKIIQVEKMDIFHVSGSEIVDRYHFALKIAEVFDLDSDLIKPIQTQQLKQIAPRPLKSGFIIDKAVRELDCELSDAEQGLKKIKKQLKKLW
ncbi:MAG: sugar nucleotide-binding protein, partial [bacterium]|nr:sugar nucleotide-binding protein [bacterium]